MLCVWIPFKHTINVNSLFDDIIVSVNLPYPAPPMMCGLCKTTHEFPTPFVVPFHCPPEDTMLKINENPSRHSGWRIEHIIAESKICKFSKSLYVLLQEILLSLCLEAFITLLPNTISFRIWLRRECLRLWITTMSSVARVWLEALCEEEGVLTVWEGQSLKVLEQ